MANGSFKSSVNTSAGNGYSRYIEVIWNSENNTDDNTSTVNWTAYSRSNDSSTSKYVYARSVVVKIGEVSKTVIGTTSTALYKDRVIGSGSVTIPHETNGTKTIAVSITAQIYTYGTNNSNYYGEITMSPNPVYDLSINTGTGSSVTVYRTSSASGNTGELVEGTKSLYYEDKLKISFIPDANYSIDTHTVNGASFISDNTHTVEKNVIIASTATPILSSVGATDANIGSTSTITITKYGGDYGQRLTYSFEGINGTVTGVIVENTFETSVAWTVPTSFYEQIPNSESVVCRIICETFNDGIYMGQTVCEMTATAPKTICAPSVSGTVIDTNVNTIVLTGDDSKLIRYKSTASCTINVEPKNSATIISKAINDVLLTDNTYVFDEVSDELFVFKATDSRGYSSSSSVTPTVIKYVPLTINPIITRPTQGGGDIVMMFSGNYFNGSFGAHSNTLTVRYRYREVGATLYSQWETIDTTSYIKETSTYSTPSPVGLGTEFDYRKAYEFEVMAFDGIEESHLTTIHKRILVAKGVPIFEWGENDFNFNVPVKFNNVNILDIMYPVGAVYMHSSDAIPEAISQIGTWIGINIELEGIYAWERTA